MNTPTIATVHGVTTPPPRVKVKVSVRNGSPQITTSHPVGSPETIAQHLPNNRLRDRVHNLYSNYGYNLDNCILHTTSTITNEQWANAIASEIICRLANDRDSEVELSTIADGAYLAIGNAVYRMSPVEIAPQSKALRAIHHRTVEKARTESDRLLNEAHAQCASLLATATENRREAERLLAEASSTGTLAPPQWAVNAGVTLRLQTSLNGTKVWCVSFTTRIKITKFIIKYETQRGHTEEPRTITTKSWLTTPVPHSPQITVWVPLNADSSYTQTLIYATPYQLPHVRATGACMSLSMAPRLLDSLAKFEQLKSAFTSAMSVVECHSLFVSPGNWHPWHQDAIPPAIRPTLLPYVGTNCEALIPIPCANTSVEPINADDESTFTAPTL